MASSWGHPGATAAEWMRARALPYAYIVFLTFLGDKDEARSNAGLKVTQFFDMSDEWRHQPAGQDNWEKLQSGEWIPPKALFTTSCRNAAKDLLRSTKSRRRVERADPIADVLAVQSHSNTDCDDDLRRDLKECLEALPEPRRTHLLDFVIGGMSFAQIADLRNTTINAIKKTTSRARADLRDCLRAKTPRDDHGGHQS